jgi:hypothetical protein
MGQDLAMLERLAQLESDGYVLIESVFTDAEALATVGLLETAFGRADDESGVMSRAGAVFAARNVLQEVPQMRTAWRKPLLVDLLHRVLGDECGLVRALYFDKPPERSWTLPWHKDLTIAVRGDGRPGPSFSKPTKKAGVPHVEAPTSLLERMLTLRIFLDDNTLTNGPLKVIAGSHRSGKSTSASDVAATLLGRRGDVLAMRPLLIHCSGHADPDERQGRRTLHLEFAADRQLWDGFEWHEFLPV